MKNSIKLLVTSLLMVMTVYPSTLIAQITFGDPKGAITVVEYFDYDCPVCRKYAPIIATLARRNTQVRIIQRVVPIVSPTSQLIDRVMLASFALGHFLIMQKRIVYSSYSKSIPPQAIRAMAQSVGMRLSQLTSVMQSVAITQQLKENLFLYGKTHQRVVPVLVFYLTSDPSHTIQVNGAVPYQQLQKVIDTLERKKHVS